jgi:hypothetical protein
MSCTEQADGVDQRSCAEYDVVHRLAVLEQEIEEHRRWLRDDPLLQYRAKKNAA